MFFLYLYSIIKVFYKKNTQMCHTIFALAANVHLHHVLFSKSIFIWKLSEKFKILIRDKQILVTVFIQLTNRLTLKRYSFTLCTHTISLVWMCSGGFHIEKGTFTFTRLAFKLTASGFTDNSWSAKYRLKLTSPTSFQNT